MAKELKMPPTPNTSFASKETDLFLRNIFDAFIADDQKLSCTEDELRQFAQKEFQLDTTKMPKSFTEHLPTILLTYMNLWSGWQFKNEYITGKIQKEHYFDRFKKHLHHKISSASRGHFTTAQKSVTTSCECSEKEGTEAERQDFAPTCISIECPSQMLNTIVFSNVGKDVMMKQHTGGLWQDLSVSQLLNWPHVEISFRSLDLYFKRRQATEYIRYLNILPHDSSKTGELIIEDCTVFGKQKCYSYNFFDAYIKHYLDALKNVPQVKPGMLYEMQTILTQFLEDIKFIDVNKSMATGTSVLFRLSTVPFIRNKKLQLNRASLHPSDDTRVGYCEIIIPKIQLSLFEFNAKQMNTAETTFESIEAMKTASDVTVFLPKITYKCTFCNKEYDKNARKEILEHFRLEHKIEEHVRCTYCKKQFDVLNLAACRWRHRCLFPHNQISQTVTIDE